MSVTRVDLSASDRGNLRVRSSLRDYEVEFDEGTAWAARLAQLDGAFVVVDENVLRLHGDAVLAPFDPRLVVTVEAVEERKTFASVSELCAEAIGRSMKRRSVLVSIGGGITQDVTGFMASVLYRGVAWVYVPTTLLAMADSCIGGKTSLNFGSHKNLLGTFYPPRTVVIHTPFLQTLPDPAYLSGLGEIVKLHLLGGAGAASWIGHALPRAVGRSQGTIQRAIRTSLEIKRDFIEDDEFDGGRRNLLNYGHCFGHALESATDFAIPHGLAVVAGMRLADIVATRRGLLDESEANRRLEALYRPVLSPFPATDPALRVAVVDAMGYDKKRTGRGLAVVVVGDDLTTAQLSDVTEREAHQALETLTGGGN